MSSPAPLRHPHPADECLRDDGRIALNARVVRPGLRWHCDPATLPFDTTDEVAPLEGVVGQAVAIEALEFGLQTSAPGQHIFVRGLTGTGRTTLLRRLLESLRPACPEAADRCYVYNFRQPDRPNLITLPRGCGRVFRKRMTTLAEFIRKDLPDALDSPGFRARKLALEQSAQQRVDAIAEPLNQALREAGLAIASRQVGSAVQTSLVPVLPSGPVPPEEFEQAHLKGEVSEEAYKAFHEKRRQFQPQVDEVKRAIAQVHEDVRSEVDKLIEGEARSLLAEAVAKVQTEFGQPEVRHFLADLADDVIEQAFSSDASDKGDFTRRYGVNVVLGHERSERCPIVVESAPTLSNLLGTIDRDYSPGADRGGRPSTNHMMIRAGSILRADGGYLVIEARDLLGEPGAWKVLVRTLRSGRLEIVPPEISMPMFAGPSLKPEPIPINVKVILLGDAGLYQMLDALDPDFPHLFKVLADFDTVIPRDEEGVRAYAGVIARMAKEESLRPFDRTGVAALCEHGARIAGRAGKLTTRFGRLADIAREAAFIADRAGNRVTTGEHVRSAVRRTKRRADLPSRRFRELLSTGTIQVRCTGAAVGQINGLAVIQAGQLTYGFPNRITATIGPGTAGVINIERESALSGAIHTKGFFILGGLLRTLLPTDHPLAFSASIAFEQSYGGIDGDSASGAEACCLISALTGIPIRQDFAMTGAIDQKGNILSIGAVNEKIEGFYDVCNDIGLTGEQGVIIPKSNAGDLMLRDDVVAACAEGRFHVYAVERIEQALSILTGYRAGTSDPRTGGYEEGTVLSRAVAEARRYWEITSQAPGRVDMAEWSQRMEAMAASTGRGAGGGGGGGGGRGFDRPSPSERPSDEGQ